MKGVLGIYFVRKLTLWSQQCLLLVGYYWVVRPAIVFAEDAPRKALKETFIHNTQPIIAIFSPQGANLCLVGMDGSLTLFVLFLEQQNFPLETRPCVSLALYRKKSLRTQRHRCLTLDSIRNPPVRGGEKHF